MAGLPASCYTLPLPFNFISEIYQWKKKFFLYSCAYVSPRIHPGTILARPMLVTIVSSYPVLSVVSVFGHHYCTNCVVIASQLHFIKLSLNEDLFIYLSVYLSLYLSIYPSIHPSLRLHQNVINLFLCSSSWLFFYLPQHQ